MQTKKTKAEQNHQIDIKLARLGASTIKCKRQKENTYVHSIVFKSCAMGKIQLRNENRFHLEVVTIQQETRSSETESQEQQYVFFS